jgi:hypothetical protein
MKLVIIFALVLGTFSISKDCILDVGALGLELAKTYADLHARPWSLPLDLLAVVKSSKKIL